MAEAPTDSPAFNWVGSLLMLALFLLIFVAAPVYNIFFPQSDNGLQLALTDAKVTTVSETNRRLSYHLDGNELEEYNFRDFVGADPAARTGYDEDVGWDSSDLSHYLRQGDRLSKAANSPNLTVRRGTTITHWVLDAFTPESKRPLPAKPPVAESPDSVYLH